MRRRPRAKCRKPAERNVDFFIDEYSSWGSYPVVGFGQPECNRIPVRVETPGGTARIAYPDRPYVARYGCDGDFSWNANNYVHGDTAMIRLRVQEG